MPTAPRKSVPRTECILFFQVIPCFKMLYELNPNKQKKKSTCHVANLRSCGCCCCCRSSFAVSVIAIPMVSLYGFVSIFSLLFSFWCHVANLLSCGWCCGVDPGVWPLGLVSSFLVFVLRFRCSPWCGCHPAPLLSLVPENRWVRISWMNHVAFCGAAGRKVPACSIRARQPAMSGFLPG